ncbi:MULTISPECIES: nucleotide sugar dehydrogenase [unclassified Priestia]|uniref:nucleotide sugar dehydrogenase n=1 Tax=unclassified Priestia TaxID=2800374 RepID=UPI00366B4438
MKTCILGLGYIGLPTALMFANHQTEVHGVDINTDIIKKLNSKKLHIYEPGLEELLVKAIQTGKINFSTAPVHSDAFIISVPTPINEDKTANLNFVIKAVEMILPYLQKGNLVILESTVPPKTVIQTVITLLTQTKLKIGEELFVAYSPERVLPGNLITEMVNNDRIVGGINEKSTELAVNLYKRFVKGNIHTTDATTAEMVKLIENTYRDINIAFANELARIAEKLGINIWEAIKLANNHPRVHIHNPGPGVGGHCIAVDPWFIVNQDPETAKLISLSRHINDNTPNYVVNKIIQLVSAIENPVVSILGLAFKGDIDDIRESPNLYIIEKLQEQGIVIKSFDPLVKETFKHKVESIEKAIEGTDCIVLLTDHNVFKYFNFGDFIPLVRTKNLFDTKNSLDSKQLKKQGFNYYLLGSSLEDTIQ